MSDGWRQASTNQPAAEPDVGSSPTHISNPKLRYEAQRALTWAGVIGLVVLTIYLAQTLLVIFAAMTFACMLDGGARLLGKVLPIGRGWLIALAILLMVGFLVWLSWFAGSQISQQATEFPRLASEQLAKVLDWLKDRGLAVGQDQVRGISENLFSGVGTVTSAIGGFLGGLATGLMILIIGIYLAIDPRPYERGLAWMVPEGQRDIVSDTLSHMAFTMRRLLAGRLLGMVVEGIFTWALLAYGGLLFGIGAVPMAALLGLITGLLAFIPNIGAIISGLLMVLIGFSGGTEMGLYTIGVYFFVQNFDGYVVVPLIAKKTVDLAPALVLGAQLIVGVLFGIFGLALADPILAMIKVALERRSHWIETNDKLAIAKSRKKPKPKPKGAAA